MLDFLGLVVLACAACVIIASTSAFIVGSAVLFNRWLENRTEGK